MSLVIGIDIGGTFLKGGVCSGSRIVQTAMVPSNANKGTAAFVRSIDALISQLREKRRIRAIGIGSAGAIDLRRGVVLRSPNTPQRNFPLRDFVKKRHKLPVFLDNDARCFTLAEALHGAGKKFRIVAGMTLGTGIGGGLVIDKKLYHGRGNAGEFGHFTVDYNGWEGPSGIRGGLEEYVGSRGVMRAGRKVSALSPQDIFARARRGERDAREVWETVGRFLGMGIAGVVYAVDPEVVVIGGQIANAWPYFHKAAKKSAKEHCFHSLPPIVRASTLNAGILGAALLCGRK